MPAPHTTKLFLGLCLACMPPAAGSFAQSMNPVGTLTCTLSPPDADPVLSARSELSCNFENMAGGPGASFTGRVKRLGVNEQRLAKFVLVWSVHTRSADFDRTDLEGDYTGSLEPGGMPGQDKARLVGGKDNAITLSPLTRDPALPEGWGITLMSLHLHPLKT